ncbi:MAG TPA: hypothetical protein VG204_15835 [Terriglobia bacterium]|nr:hypothetical protein [Terriglobia bacterium]
MDLYKTLTGEALTLVRDYETALDRLPRTFLVDTLVELEHWPVFFEPEKAYFRALVDQLAALDVGRFHEIFGSLQDFERRTGCDRVRAADIDEFEARALAYVQRQGVYSEWRHEIDGVFEKLEPMVEARLYSGSLPPRLVVILYGEGIAIERNTLWKRFRTLGTRVPLDLHGAQSSEPFLRALFTGQPAIQAARAAGAAAAPTLFQVLGQSLAPQPANFAPLNAWIIEAGDALHRLCRQGGQAVRTSAGDPAAHCATGISYDLLRDYRDQLTQMLWAKVKTGLRSPLELAGYVKTLEVRPHDGVTLYSDPAVLAFIRDTFLAGNGTLIINNTFVEWGAVRALKRAQPRLLVARFGVRDKMKPFSSLLLFSKPRPTDQIPIMQDPLGSFVDSELLAYYIWLNAEKGPPYKGNTMYLLLAEGVDEMLVVSPATSPHAQPPAAATLPDVAATMARWLGITMPGSPGRPIEPLFA